MSINDGRYENALALEEAVHLVVLQHGLHGSPKDYASLQPILASVLQEHGVHVVASQSNSKDFTTTHDGIDLGGVRLADEVEVLAAQCPKLRKISFIGHSLGGLYVRYCIGVLYARGFFANIEPMNFIAVATPHLGIRNPTSRGAFNSIFNTISSKLFDRTGAQLTLRDAVSEDTRALASIHTLTTASRPSFPELSAHLNIQLAAPNSGFSKLFGALVANSATWNVYFSHLDVSQAPLFSFDLTHFDAVLFLPDPPTPQPVGGSPPDNEDEVRQAYYFAQALPHPRDTVLQLRGRHDGDAVAVDVAIESTTDWAFVHGVLLRLGSLSCLTYSGDKLALRQYQQDLAAAAEAATLFPLAQTMYPEPAPNQHLLQCLCQGAFLHGLHAFRRRALYSNVFYDVQAPYSCSALRAFNPYRSNVVPVTTSPVYPHITLHSMENAAVLRASVLEFTAAAAHEHGADPKPKTWLQGLATIPAYMFPLNKTTDANALPPEPRICHVVSKASDKVLVDTPDDTYSNDDLRDVLRAMLVCIQSLEWERVDVLIESMMSHELIIAKRSDQVPAHESGLDIVHHVADTFVVE